MPATISILGLFTEDRTILDPLINALPDSDISLAVKESILAECAELEVLYPTPTVFKTILEAWCAYRSKVWSDLWKTTNLEYNPIHNYDRTEIENINKNGTSNTDSQSKDTGKDGNFTTVESRYGFNSRVAKTPVAERVDTPESYNYNSNSNMKNVVTGDEARSLHISGNIGVTTTQQMIKDQREVVKYDFVEDVVNDFKARFCLLVY